MKQHSPRFLSLVNDAKKRIVEINAHTLRAKLYKNEPLTLIDVREDNEWDSSGHIPTAIHLGKGVIERDIEKIIPDPTQPIVLYCSGGFRCALVADSLRQMGYQQVSSLDEGLNGWIEAGYDVER